jgi:L-rhamnose mutarotase
LPDYTRELHLAIVPAPKWQHLLFYNTTITIHPYIGSIQNIPGGNMLRKAFVMSVNKGLEREYEERHTPVWPEMEKTLKAHGVHNYSIFLHPQTNQLFGYVEIEDQEQWDAIARTSVCRKWWAYMKDIMPSNPDNSPVSVEIKEVFHLQ